MKTTDLDGVMVPITTPLHDDEIALDELRDNLRYWCRTDLCGFLVLGSTGESVALDEREKRELLEAAREAIPADRVMLAGATAESTRGTIELGRSAARLGADAALVGVPTYFASMIDDEALRRHYAMVAEALEIPVLLYSVPKFTRRELGVGLIDELSLHDNIIGIKESGERPERLAHLAGPGAGTTDFMLLSGHALHFARALRLGYTGGILGLANADPELCCAVHRAVRAGDEKSLALGQARLEQLGRGLSRLGIGGLKKVMEWRGLHGGPPRLPLRPPNPAEEEHLRESLAGALTPGTLRAEAAGADP